MSSCSTEAPAWFHNRIVDGLQMLYALSLQGCPSAEVLPLTFVSWVQVLWAGRPWVEELDSERLPAAFIELARRAERWPAPGQLVGHLPPRPPALKLPEPQRAASASVRAPTLAARDRIKARAWNKGDNSPSAKSSDGEGV